MNRNQLARWLREQDQKQVDQIRMLSDAAEKLPPGEEATRMRTFLKRLVEHHMEFHAVIFETDEGEAISLAQINLGDVRHV